MSIWYDEVKSNNSISMAIYQCMECHEWVLVPNSCKLHASGFNPPRITVPPLAVVYLQEDPTMATDLSFLFSFFLYLYHGQQWSDKPCLYHIHFSSCSIHEHIYNVEGTRKIKLRRVDVPSLI